MNSGKIITNDMIIDDIVHVLGKGYIFICTPNKEIHINDLVNANGTNFRVTGIEDITHTQTVGLVLSPNVIAFMSIKKSDNVEIIHNNINYNLK